MQIASTLRARAPWLVSLSLAALLLIAAADRPAPRVAIVDADRIRLDSSYVRGKLTQMSGPAEAIKSQMIEKQAALKAAVDAYQGQASAMSDAAKEAKVKEINQLKADAEALSSRFDDALNKAGNEDLEAMRKQIMDIVAKIAAERGMDAVFSTANVLYNAKEIDLTDEVIRRLDASAGAAAPKPALP